MKTYLQSASFNISVISLGVLGASIAFPTRAFSMARGSTPTSDDVCMLASQAPQAVSYTYDTSKKTYTAAGTSLEFFIFEANVGILANKTSPSDVWVTVNQDAQSAKNWVLDANSNRPGSVEVSKPFLGQQAMYIWLDPMGYEANSLAYAEVCSKYKLAYPGAYGSFTLSTSQAQSYGLAPNVTFTADGLTWNDTMANGSVNKHNCSQVSSIAIPQTLTCVYPLPVAAPPKYSAPILTNNGGSAAPVKSSAGSTSSGGNLPVHQGNVQD